MNAIGLGVMGSLVTGVLSGWAWILGNGVRDHGLVWLVLVAIPVNLVAALLFYFVVRGSVASAEAGVGLLVLIGVINLGLTLAVAAWIAGVIGTGVGKTGAHLFSWGMAYAYGQAFRDVRAGTWFDE